MPNTYDPKKIILIFGAKELSGFADGTFIDVEPLGDGITSVCGADGEVARSMDPDTRAKVTITLLSTSQSNDYLSALYILDKQSGAGMFPFLIKDLLGKTVVSSQYSWITQFPKMTNGMKVEDGHREWVIETGGCEWFIGGAN
jgi:hypothetical protein